MLVFGLVFILFLIAPFPDHDLLLPYYTLQLIKYKRTGPCNFREDCSCFSYSKAMGTNDQRGRAIFYPGT